MQNPQAEKKAIRTDVIAARDAMPFGQRIAEAGRVCESIMGSMPYQGATTVLAYASFGSELDTTALLERILADKKNLLDFFRGTTTI